MHTSYFPPTTKQVLVDFVKANPRVATTVPDIAKAIGKPHSSVREVVYQLVKEGAIRIVESRRGRGGGIVLEVV
jgi:DNA-binding IscR family transcriptional regulator